MAEREVDLAGAGFQVDRERVLARMAQAQGQGQAHAQRGWLGYAALAAAGVAALITGARFWQHSAASGANASLEIMVSEGSAVQAIGNTEEHVLSQRSARIEATGDLQTAASSQASLRMADGLQVELRSQTRLGLAGLQASKSQVNLLGGAIRCTVPHRTAAHAFQVVTADATVVDLGTVFTVSIEGPNHATRVSVEEGEVLVRFAAGQVRVQAPGSWSSVAVVAPVAPTAVSAPEPAESAPAALAPDATATAKSVRSVGKPSSAATLDQEAQLLRQGLAAERQGHSSEAISALSQLLQKYPHSPLAPDARAALTRVEASPQQ
jgi:TolA-binding protein